MERLTESILQRVTTLPEGAPVSAKMLLHLGTRPAVDQSLSRLARRGQLLRAGRGMYVSPVTSRFGTHAPSAHRLIEEFSAQRGEVVVRSGAASANALGLTTQVPKRTVYWTSGRSRSLNLGKLVIKLEHVPSWPACLRQGAGRGDRPCARMGRTGASSICLARDRGQGSQGRDPEGSSTSLPFPRLDGERLEPECRQCLRATSG
jgi:hypothetical protein